MINYLFGAVAGDVSGSAYESKFTRTKDYSKVRLIKKGDSFTDDAVCTFGVADALLRYTNPTVEQFGNCIQEWCQKYPNRGYGGMFKNWIKNPVPYGSYGNGSAMRVSPIGFFSKTEKECRDLAKASAECSHNHKEGIKGAQAIALSIFYAKDSSTKNFVNKILSEFYPEYIGKTLDDIRPSYRFDSTCKGSVSVAILAFLESENYENCIKLAISLGGDSDTLAAMAGGIAYSYYKKMQNLIIDHVVEALPREMLSLSRNFDKVVNEHIHSSNS